MFIFGFIRFAVYFSISFFILMIPIKNQTLFDYMRDMTSDVRHGLMQGTEKASKTTLKYAKDFGTKLFTNSRPSDSAPKTRDRVKSTQSSTQRKNSPSSKIIKKEELEHIAEDDMQQLDRFLQAEE